MRRPFLDRLISSESDIDVDSSKVDRNNLNKLDYSRPGIITPDLPHVDDLPVKEAAQPMAEDDQGSVKVESKSGLAESGADAGWYKVTFSKPFNQGTRPVIVAVCEERKGEIGGDGNFTPPSHGSPEGDSPSLVDVNLSGISFGDIDIRVPEVDSYQIGSYSVGSVEIPGVDISDYNLSSKSIDRAGISAPSIGGVSGLDDVGVNIDNRLDSPLIDHSSAIPSFSFESELKDRTRQTGEDAYDFMSDIIYNTMPSQLGLDDKMANLFDDLFNVLYGSGRTDQSGEGLIESTYGYVGAILDDAVTNSFGDKAQEQLTLASEVEIQMDNYNQQVATKVNDIAQEVDADFTELSSKADRAVSDLDSNINDASNQLASNTNAAFGEMGSNIEGSLNDVVSDANTVTSNIVEDVNAGLDSLSINITDELASYNDNINASLDNIVADNNAANANISQDINEAMQLLGDDINQAMSDQSANTEEEMNAFIDDLDGQMTDLRDETQEGFNSMSNLLNEMMSILNDNVQQSYSELSGLSEEAMNKSPDILYDSIGAPQGVLVTPVNIRNVDNEGFEFLGYDGGMTINWVARGIVDESTVSDDPDTGNGEDDDNGDDGRRETPILDEISDRIDRT